MAFDEWTDASARAEARERVRHLASLSSNNRMNAYLYRAALYCEPCGEQIQENIDGPGVRIVDDPIYDDSEHWPQLVTNGGGEADSPRHCDACLVFLKNPLTADGLAYVRQDGWADAEQVAEWRSFYALAQ